METFWLLQLSLNNADDDHAGDGRIIQFDSELNLKGTLWTENTTHLVGGLKFDQDNNLWAFDSQNYSVVKVSPNGEQINQIDFGARSFSNACFSSIVAISSLENILLVMNLIIKHLKAQEN